MLASIFIGSIPLGRMFIKRMTNKDASYYSVYNLGVENVFQIIGPTVAIGSFAIDILKSYLALYAFRGSPWAAVGVYLGHLYPYSYFFLYNKFRWFKYKVAESYSLPRGRGNGVLLGILIAWVVLGEVPWWNAGLTVVGYAFLLALTSYVSLSSILAFLIFVFSYLLFIGGNLSAATIMLLLLVIWRNKTSISGIVNNTEPKFGDEPAVFGRDESKVLAAFMIHPMTIEDVWQTKSLRWLKYIWNHFSFLRPFVSGLLRQSRPQVLTIVKGIELEDNRDLEVMLIGSPMLPKEIKQYPELATKVAIQGARLAKSHGAEAFGLGAFWSTVGNKGLDVQKAVDIEITNGGAYTAASVKAAIPSLLNNFKAQGGDLSNATVAIVGANGVVAFGVARVIAKEVSKLILIGTDLNRLERSANTLRKKHPELDIEYFTQISKIAEADIIVSATSDPEAIIFAKDVKENAWIFDLGRPADVADDVLKMPYVYIIPGGMVKPPGEMLSAIDLHFGDGLIPACMAETMIMTASRQFERKSLGPMTKSKNIDFYLEEGKRLGFEIITTDPRRKG